MTAVSHTMALSHPMAAIRSGGETSGANSTSNAPAAHIITIDREPTKQLLPQIEMEKLNPISPMNNTGPREMYNNEETENGLGHTPIFISAMAIHVSSSVPGTSAARISSLPFPHPEEEKVMNYEESLEFVRDYFQALKRRLEAAMPDEFDFEKIGDTLGVFRDFLAKEKVELERMRAAHQARGNSLDAKSYRIGRRRIGYALLFTVAAAISSGAAVVTAHINDIRVAAAAGGGSAAASVLFIAVGKGVDRYLKKRESALEKYKSVIKAIIADEKTAIEDLRAIYVLARDLQSDTASAFEMVNDGAALGKKMAALKQSFQKLEMEVNRCSLDVNFATEAVLQSIITNVD